MLASGKNGNQYTKTYAGTSQNEMLTQKSQGGNYEFVYGRTDANGLPIIEQVKRDNATAYIEHDPVTGEPLILRTSSGLASLYIYDGTGNPAALITSGAYTAFAYTYDPYGVPTLTKDSGGNGKPQNPYSFKQGLQDRSTGWVKYGARWYDPITGRWTQQDTLDAPLDPRNANRYAFAANDPINNSDPLGLAFFEGSLEVCFYACLSVGYAEDENGDSAITGGVGIGNPGVSVGGEVGTGDVSTGIQPEINCGAGFATGSVSPGGVSGGVGTGFSTPKCSAGVGGSIKL